eukprot:2133106-Rhodomonas_salina.1
MPFDRATGARARADSWRAQHEQFDGVSHINDDPRAVSVRLIQSARDPEAFAGPPRPARQTAAAKMAGAAEPVPTCHCHGCVVRCVAQGCAAEGVIDVLGVGDVLRELPMIGARERGSVTLGGGGGREGTGDRGGRRESTSACV